MRSLAKTIERRFVEVCSEPLTLQLQSLTLSTKNPSNLSRVRQSTGVVHMVSRLPIQSASWRTHHDIPPRSIHVVLHFSLSIGWKNYHIRMHQNPCFVAHVMKYQYTEIHPFGCVQLVITLWACNRPELDQTDPARANLHARAILCASYRRNIFQITLTMGASDGTYAH